MGIKQQSKYARNGTEKLDDFRFVIDDVKRRIDLRNVIPNIQPKTANYSVGLCPFHNEAQPSFTVYADHYYCFGCQKSGDVIEWYINQGMDFMQALHTAAAIAGVVLDDKNEKQIKQAATEREWLSESSSQFSHALESEPDVMDYLMNERGLSWDTIKHFGIGYCESNGKIRNAVAIPIRSKTRSVATFAYRFLGENGNGKYIIYNSSTWKKSDNFYNSEVLLDIAAGEPIYIVEGYFDVMRMWQAGYKHTVGMIGSSLTDAHVAALGNNPVVFIPDAKVDSDFDLFKKAVLNLRRVHPNLPAKVALLDDGDAGDATPEELHEAIDNALSVEFAILKRDLDGASDQNEQYAIARSLVRRITDGLIIDDIYDYLAERWNKEKAVVKQALSKKTETQLKPLTISDALDQLEMIERQSAIDGLHAAWPSLSQFINRPHIMQLLFFAARTSVGKTMWALNYIRMCKDSEMPTVFFSMEQPMGELANRLAIMASAELGMPPGKVANDIITDCPDWQTRRGHLEASYPHLRFFEHGMSIAEMGDAIVDSSIGFGEATKVVIVDYLGLVKSNVYGDSYERVSEVARELQNMVKEKGVFCICLHQLSRKGGTGGEKVTFDMMRDSGVTEEVADYIIGAWIDSINVDIAPPGFDRMSFSVCKNRHGKTGDGALWFDKNYLLMTDAPEYAGDAVAVAESGAGDDFPFPDDKRYD